MNSMIVLMVAQTPHPAAARTIIPFVLCAVSAMSAAVDPAVVLDPAVVQAEVGCDLLAPFPCLPGIDAIGVGYDAVRGTSFGVGRPVIQTNYTKAGNVWTDPFGNRSSYSYPDQASVMQRTDQRTKHLIYRSVRKYVSQQQNNANVDGSYGMFFKTSIDTQWAQTTMSDSLHIVSESSCEIGVYTITLDAPLFLKPDLKFEQFVDSLPAEYDEHAYAEFIRYYGTHYVAAGTLGGRGRMRTVISHDYYSTQSDSSISAQLHIAWGLFGGGGGGGSSSHTHDQTWTSNADSSTHTEGGDPAISSFNSSAEWTAWARSVTSTSPVLTSVTLEPLWSMIPVTDPRRNNTMKAVLAYASNETFPDADPASYQMSWCDCKVAPFSQGNGCQRKGSGGHCPVSCPEGYVVTGHVLAPLYGHDGYEIMAADGHGTTCCRPCFTAQD